VNEILAALLAFNAAVIEARDVLAPHARVFVGAQVGEGTDAYAWTKCIPESEVFVVQVAEKTLLLDNVKIRFAAAHEVCHVVMHGAALCRATKANENLPGPLSARKHEMENEADDCAIKYLYGQ